jgi:5-methylcytosine-specific restriction endonuclease McrA
LPPKNVRTVRDLIYWEYAILIAGSAVGDRKNRPFTMSTYTKLKKRKLHPSNILRENKMLVEECANCCAYCECKENLQWEHIIPKSRGGSDNIDNMVQSCQKCNLSKGDKDPYEWYGKERKYEIPRLPLGKYLKLVFEAHEKADTLDSLDLNIDGTLDVLDLGAIFRRK